MIFCELKESRPSDAEYEGDRKRVCVKRSAPATGRSNKRDRLGSSFLSFSCCAMGAVCCCAMGAVCITVASSETRPRSPGAQSPQPLIVTGLSGVARDMFIPWPISFMRALMPASPPGISTAEAPTLIGASRSCALFCGALVRHGRQPELQDGAYCASEYTPDTLRPKNEEIANCWIINLMTG